jgi:hypothetical protein
MTPAALAVANAAAPILAPWPRSRCCPSPTRSRRPTRSERSRSGMRSASRSWRRPSPASPTCSPPAPRSRSPRCR